MSGTYKKLGEDLELEIQLGDGAKFASTRVFARIDDLEDPFNTLVAEFELVNQGEGTYTDKTHTMPTNDEIKVIYFIRKANGVSVEAKYNPHFLSEIFLRDFTGELIDNNLDAKVSSGQNTDIVGSADEDAGLEGALIEEILIGSTEQDTIIEGVVDES